MGPLVLLAVACLGQNLRSFGDSRDLEAECVVFSHPDHFVGKTVTVEAVVYSNGSPEGDLSLRPVATKCEQVERLWFSLNESSVRRTKTGREFLKFLKEPAPLPRSLGCWGCLRYKITRLIARGQLRSLREVNKADSRIVIDFDKIGAPRYSLLIDHVILVDAKEITYSMPQGADSLSR